MEKTILIVDDEPLIVKAIGAHLKRAGYLVEEAETAEAGLERMAERQIDLVLLDITIPAMGGEALLKKLRELNPDLPVVVLTGDRNPELAARCLKNGAMDFLNKPCDSTRLLTTIKNALQLHILEDRLREVSGVHESLHGFDFMFGRSTPMLRIFDQLRMLAQSEINVLVEGASGTGKELVARALHRKGPRREGPFLGINCGAIPEMLLESELFGHERGAFTGAVNSHAGCFEQAEGGTLFLDEIGETRPEMQVRLLRVIETRELQRVGGTKRIKVNVRLITATNRNLRERVAAGAFREDLYYRIAVYRLKLPALRERGNDGVELAERFVVEFGGKFHKRGLALSPHAAIAVRNYGWPGNIRQLRNAMERAALLARGQQIELRDLPEEVVAAAVPASESQKLFAVTLTAEAASKQIGVAKQLAPPSRRRPPSGVHSLSYSRDDEILSMEAEEKRILARALRITKGDVSEAAKKLQIGRATLYRRIKELNLPQSAG